MIREARDSDSSALHRVAQRDSSRPPASPILLAELDGEVQAAISLADGSVIADPFRPTADLIALLEVRATHVRQAGGTSLHVVAPSQDTAPRELRHAA